MFNLNAFCLSLLLIGIATDNSFGQSKSKPVKLIGTWRLIEFADLDPKTATWTYSYGKNPQGYFTYTSSGVLNLNICAEKPLKISEDSAKSYTINLKSWLDSNSVGYFGTYTVDYAKSTVIHHVKGGSLTWYIDTDQSRPFIIKNDTLIIGDNKTWRRILVKAD
ncbi:MAG: lipocalin-like domain-containing protein [Chitinophagaceae bacterium]